MTLHQTCMRPVSLVGSSCDEQQEQHLQQAERLPAGSSIKLYIQMHIYRHWHTDACPRAIYKQLPVCQPCSQAQIPAHPCQGPHQIAHRQAAGLMPVAGGKNANVLPVVVCIHSCTSVLHIQSTITGYPYYWLALVVLWPCTFSEAPKQYCSKCR